MKKLAIIGAGDLGKLVLEHALDSGYDVVGFFDDTKNVGKLINNCPILGGLNEVNKQFETGVFETIFIAIGYNHMDVRKAIFDDYKSIIPFANIIHPSAFVHRTSILGEGIIIFPGCVLDVNVRIGDNVLLNTGCVIAHDSSIGAHSFLSPSVALAGFIRIGEQCNLGIGTIVIDNISVSDNVRTGGGAVVIKDIKEPSLYVGVPAKKISK